MRQPAAARKILSNLFHLSAGELVARLAHFAAFAHLARVLGAAEFGRLGIVLTIVSYLLIPVLQGYDSVGIRDVARDPARLARYVGNIMTIRLLAAGACWGALAAALQTGSADPRMRSLLLLFGLTLFASAASVKWAFQAMERTRPVALAGILAQLVFAAGAFTVPGPAHILRVPLYQFAGELAGAAVLAIAFLARFGRFRPAFDLALWKTLFRESLPLAAATVLGTVLFNFDVLALAHFHPADQAGLYTAAYKLVLLFATLLTLLQLSLFPTLARAWRDGADLDRIAGRALRYVCAALVPLAFAGLFLAPRALAALFGPEYAAAGNALKILLWSLPWMGLRSVFRIILVSCNLQGLDLSAMLAGAVTNVALDLLLVPEFGILGAAVSTLTSELVILVASYRAVWRRVQPVYVLVPLYRPALAASCMLVPGWALSALPLAVQAAGAGLVYLGVLFLIRGITWKEIAALYRA